MSKFKLPTPFGVLRHPVLSRVAGLLVLGCLLMLNAWALHHNAFKTFFLFDMNIPLDGSWRVFMGQKPLVDFLNNWGPVHFYAMAVFYWIFGFGKTALLAHVIAVSSVVITVLFVSSRARLPLWMTALACTLTTVSFYWSCAFPWHSHTAHFWGILGTALLIWRLPFSGRKETLVCAFACGFLALLAFITKTNVGLAYAAVFGAVFLAGSSRRLETLAAFAAGILASAIVWTPVFIHSWKAFLEQNVLGYGLHSRGRILRLITIPILWFSNGAWIFVLTGVANGVGRFKHSRALVVLLLGLWFTDTFTTFTSGAEYRVDVQLLGFIAAAAFLLAWRNRPETGCAESFRRRWFRRVSIMVIAANALCLIPLHAKYAKELKWWSEPYLKSVEYEDYNPVGSYALKSHPFEGWLCDPYKGKEIDEVVDFVKKTVPVNESLLILTDLQVVNALTGRQGYPGVTLFWIDGEWPTKGLLREQVRQNILSNPPDWILTHQKRVPFGYFIAHYLKLREIFLA
ncbi:MAG: hypothetical protein HQL11_05095, partial [Candidatus Omnitrophica bacterium]|nr:hypothetical protein [Candidatus Omnitrophota bacterium]